ncbi:MAG: ribulose-phosphate 3-epimerase [Acidobacteriota bacterium]
MLIAPSILSADLADLAGALVLCERAPADWVHVDVMDGHFVPNLSFGLPVLAAISKRTSLPLDVHLMITNPDEMAEAYVGAGAAAVTVHWEATRHLHRLLSAIRRRGARAGVAINPATPAEVLVDILPQVDQVLLMSVNPGFSGQEFIPETLDKARRLRQILAGEGGRIRVGLDGGVGRSNIHQAAEAGVHYCVAGSAVFAAADPVAEIRALRSAASGDLA